MGADWRGDPSSALLEVLDPEQNNTFNDHYLEVDYDLSDVMFVTTANTLRMPQPLMDRMEIIRIRLHRGREGRDRQAPPDPQADGSAWAEGGRMVYLRRRVRDVIRYYAREAGVRNLERELANLARKAVKEIVTGGAVKVAVSRKNLSKFAGVRKYRFGEVEMEDMVGVVTGLAWTEVGGELLSIESVTVPGKGKVNATGKLGEVMRESVQAAESFVKSRSLSFGIQPKVFEDRDIHVHVPGDAEGRPLGGCRHGHIHRFGAHRHSGTARRRHDRRGDIARAGPAHRRAEGKTVGGVAWWLENRF